VFRIATITDKCSIVKIMKPYEHYRCQYLRLFDYEYTGRREWVLGKWDDVSVSTGVGQIISHRLADSWR